MIRLGVSLIEGHYAVGDDAGFLRALDRWTRAAGAAPSHTAIWKSLTPMAHLPRANGFPSRDLLTALRERGITPMVNLDSRAYPGAVPDIDTFLDGEWDGDIIIRKDWEMNGRWAPWSKALTPTEYVREWRSDDRAIRGRYPNARLFWCAQAMTADHYRTLASFWPGAEYVDIMGFDRYDLGARRPLDEAWAKPLEALRDLPGAAAIPVGVGEWGLSKGRGRIRVLESLTDVRGVRFGLYFDIDRSVAERDPIRDWSLTVYQRRRYGRLITP